MHIQLDSLFGKLAVSDTVDLDAGTDYQNCKDILERKIRVTAWACRPEATRH